MQFLSIFRFLAPTGAQGVKMLCVCVCVRAGKHLGGIQSEAYPVEAWFFMINKVLSPSTQAPNPNPVDWGWQ